MGKEVLKGKGTRKRELEKIKTELRGWGLYERERSKCEREVGREW